MLLRHSHSGQETLVEKVCGHVVEEVSGGVLPLVNAVRAIRICHHLEGLIESDELVEKSLSCGVVAVIIA
jgi:hypothetical protein